VDGVKERAARRFGGGEPAAPEVTPATA